jgi:hypothetical protein
LRQINGDSCLADTGGAADNDYLGLGNFRFHESEMMKRHFMGWLFAL